MTKKSLQRNQVFSYCLHFKAYGQNIKDYWKVNYRALEKYGVGWKAELTVAKTQLSELPSSLRKTHVQRMMKYTTSF